MGVSRVGSLVKNLLIKTDRMFHMVVICTEWPTRTLFGEIASLLADNFQVRKAHEQRKHSSRYRIGTMDRSSANRCSTIE